MLPVSVVREPFHCPVRSIVTTILGFTPSRVPVQRPARLWSDAVLAEAVGAGQRRFSEEHLKLLIAIGHQAALAVEDTTYYSAMVQSERMAAVGHTIATLSHHIKNILQGIRGGSYLVEMGLENDDLEPLPSQCRLLNLMNLEKGPG
jgi:signal transduction histidine kinase